MRLLDLISPERVIWLRSEGKEEALKELVEVLARAKQVGDKDELMKAIMERESIMSTGIGLGIAVPHAKISSVTDFVIAIGISKKGIDFNSLDDKPVHIIVMIAGPNKQEVYLRILAKVVLMLKSEEVRRRILEASSPEEVIRVIGERDE